MMIIVLNFANTLEMVSLSRAQLVFAAGENERRVRVSATKRHCVDITNRYG